MAPRGAVRVDGPPRLCAARQVSRLSRLVPVIDWIRAVLRTFSGELAKCGFSMCCRANLYLATAICDFNLADLLEAHPALSTPFCQLLTRHIGLAAQALHDRRIALVDLAPSNVLFSGEQHTATFCKPGYACSPQLRENLLQVDFHGSACAHLTSDGHSVHLFCARHPYAVPELSRDRNALDACQCPYALDVSAYGAIVGELVDRTPEGP
jgi:serine/threonine protein kinase